MMSSDSLDMLQGEGAMRGSQRGGRSSQPVVMHICTSCEPYGGIWTYIKQISESRLAGEYHFETSLYPRSRWGHIGALVELVRCVRKCSPGIVHVHGLQLEGFFGVLAARIAGVSCVLVTIHGFVEDCRVRRAWKKAVVARVFESLTLSFATAFFCVSTYGSLKRVVRQHPGKSLGVVNNGLAPIPFGISTYSSRESLGRDMQAAVIMLYVGRITRDKGVLDLPPILAKARALSGVDIRAVLVGDGPAMGELRLCIDSCKVADIVLLAGYQSNTLNYFQAADIFVLPSRHEHQSYAILEAMRCSLPVVAYAVGGNAELVIPDVTGHLAKACDIDGLAQRVAELAGNVSSRKVLGGSGFERWGSEFSSDLFIEKIGNNYRQILSGEVASKSS